MYVSFLLRVLVSNCKKIESEPSSSGFQKNTYDALFNFADETAVYSIIAIENRPSDDPTTSSSFENKTYEGTSSFENKAYKKLQLPSSSTKSIPDETYDELN